MQQRIFFTVMSSILLVLGSPGGSAGTRVAKAQGKPAAFAAVLMAHSGGREGLLASITRCRAIGVRITPTFNSDFIEREVLVAVDGAAFRRETMDPSGSRRQIEVQNRAGWYGGLSVTKGEGPGYTTAELVRSEERLRATKFNVQTCGLASLLQDFALSAEANWVGRTKRMEDRFRVVTSSGEWLITADQEHLIRAVERGHVRIQYSDYREVQGIHLPYLQRVWLGNKLAYELHLRTIDLDPKFSSDYFEPDSLAAPVGIDR